MTVTAYYSADEQRVALALMNHERELRGLPLLAFDEFSDSEQQHHLERARVAVAAMREVSARLGMAPQTSPEPLACVHCGASDRLVGTACFDCVTPCPECGNLADPAAVGGFCPQHEPADNTLPVDEPGT